MSHPTSVSAIDSNASSPSATNSWSIATVVGSPVRVTTSREAREAGHGREPRLLAEERGHLEVGVQTRLEPAVRLEQERVAQDDRRVRLVGAEIALGTGPLRREVGAGREPVGTRAPRSAAPAGRPRAGSDGDRPALGHRHGQGPPRPITRHGRPQRLAGQREPVRLPAAVIERDRRQREDVRTRRVERERLIELDARDRPALGAEPALAR